MNKKMQKQLTKTSFLEGINTLLQLRKTLMQEIISRRDELEDSDYYAIPFINAKKIRMESILNYIKKAFPQLKEEIKWNQPMFTDHGTFIIAFSIAKAHIAVAPEAAAIDHFEKEIEEAGYSYTEQLFRIKWTDKVDYDLLQKIVAFNIEDKKDMVKFWR